MTSLAENSLEFLTYLESWMDKLPEMPLGTAVLVPQETALISVDVIKGFCDFGPLSSPRVARIAVPISLLFEKAWKAGIRELVLTQDTHEPDAMEFGQWPPHCIRGTAEAEAVDSIRALPFFSQIRRFEKNSISSGINTGLNEWLRQHPELNTFLVVGDCTDLCTYQLAMYLRLDANARQLQRRVIVPVDCVDTYDRSVETARTDGGMPHDASLTHALFLYHMALNGVEVISKID